MKKYALCVGVNDYPGTENDLSECVNDMYDWSSALQSAGFEVRQLRDRFATRRNILDQLNWLMDQGIKGDSIIVTRSSHGSQVPDDSGDEADRMDEVMCCYDMVENGPIFDDEMWQIFKRKRPGVQLVMFDDLCHSESGARAFEVPAKGRKRFMHYRHFMRGEKRFFNTAPKEGDVEDRAPWPVLDMSGCRAHEYCYDAPVLKNGAFTFYALKALEQVGREATYDQWFKAIGRYLPSKDYPQTPTMMGSFGGKKVLS